MRGAVGGCQLLDGQVAREIATGLAVGNVNVGNLSAAVNLTVVSHKRWQPPRRASDALILLNAHSEALARVVRHADDLFKRVR